MEREEAGDATEQDSLEAHAITWPGYFADPEQVPPMPPVRFSNEAFGPLVAAMTDDAPDVANALAVSPALPDERFRGSGESRPPRGSATFLPVVDTTIESAIVGFRRPDQVNQILGAADLTGEISPKSKGGTRWTLSTQSGTTSVSGC